MVTVNPIMAGRRKLNLFTFDMHKDPKQERRIII